jgi:hypothetical protein
MRSRILTCQSVTWTSPITRRSRCGCWGCGWSASQRPFGCGVDLAVEADEFGGEQFDFGDRVGDRDGLLAGQQHRGLG